MITIGVLDLQGSVVEHVRSLAELEDVSILKVKYASQLTEIDGLILPGGESTTLGKLLISNKLKEPLIQKIQAGLPIWGTCAGLILLASSIHDDDTVHLGTMDISVVRNGYGGQLDSFIANEYLPFCNSTIPLVFIRAPYIVSVGPQVDILKTYQNRIIAAKQDHMLVTSFHPELTRSLGVHQYFLKMIIDGKKNFL